MLVFRQGRRTQSGRAVLQSLLEAIGELSGPETGSRPDRVLDALLRCGELECALADVESAHCPVLAAATDTLAEMLLGRRTRVSLSELLARLERVIPPPTVTVSTPEGFAFYGLHPLQYADLANALLVAPANAGVVGIRSIGTTLSAVVAAALRRRGIVAERATVRPGGHPFNRATEFGSELRRWIAAQRARSAEFLVVDEGPGLSGSSFLSVGDALLQAGVPRNSIAFLCGAQPNPSRLRAPNGAQRWREFRSYAVLPRATPPVPAALDVSAGEWRRHLLDAACSWPASWTTMERTKFLSRDGGRFFKFEGLGHLGAAVETRARAMAAAGFAPACENAGDGYLAYVRERGLPATRMEICSTLLDRLAEYCAFRAAEFRVADSQREDLAAMASWNLHEEFGVPYEPRETGLETGNPLVADGRMQPHEWLLTSGGILKTDGASHGDDHFFPGPVDIAWDLAGVLVEWDLGRDAGEYMLRRYAELSGDSAQKRIPAWEQAYTAFRMGYCKMAAESLSGTVEEERLLRDYRRYRARASAVLAQPAAA